MGINDEDAKLDLINETLKKLVDSMNAGNGAPDLSSVMVRLATIETDIKYIQCSMKDLKMALWGLAAGILALVAKMVIEGAFK